METRESRFGLSLLALLILANCTEKQTTRATPERLDALLQSGLDSETRARADERLTRALGRDNATGGLAGVFDESPGSGTAQSMSALFASTMQRNPDIGRAVQAINRADAERMNAIYGYLPQLSASYTYTQIDQEVVATDNAVFERGRATYPVTNIGAELRQPIFDLSRIYNIQLRSTARSGAEIEYVAAVQAAAFETFDAYVAALQSKYRIRSIQSRMSLMSRQIAAESTLVESGLSTDLTGRTYAAELASLSSEEAIESSRFASALSRLSYVTGSVVTDVEAPSGGLRAQGGAGRMSVDEAVAAAEASNPSILASAISVVETELGRKQALAADFSPVIDAFARYEDETREGSRFGGGSQTRDTNIGVRLTIPIFNAQGQGYASTLETVDLRDAALEYFAVRRQIRTEIAATIARMTELQSAIGQSSRALSEVSANVRAEEARVAAGESVDIAVLSRRLTESSAREQLEFQQLEYLKAWGRLQYLTGADLTRQSL